MRLPSTSTRRRRDPTAAAWGLAVTMVASAGLGVVGCAPTAEEGLAVSAQTDYVPIAEFDAVRVTVDPDRAADVSVGAADSFGTPHPLRTFRDLPSGRRTIEVSLRRGDTVVATRRVEVPFERSRLVNVVLARSCGGVVCTSAQTCAGGRCVTPDCSDGFEPSCPRPTCESSGDCRSDTSCVTPVCVAGLCLETGAEGACALGEVCVPGLECVRLGIDASVGGDAGPADVGGADAPPPPDAVSDGGPRCGDGRCDRDEDCMDCSRDCGDPRRVCDTCWDCCIVIGWSGGAHCADCTPCDACGMASSCWACGEPMVDGCRYDTQQCNTRECNCRDECPARP